jgi:Entner-Doudoroff aldolase
MDDSSVYFNALSEHVERAMGLMAEVVRTPTFPAEEFEKLRQQVITGLTISSNEPSYIAERELRKHLFGAHPYARTSTGEIGDVEALKVEDAQEWWQRFARPDQATLIFAGDIDLARARALGAKFAISPGATPELLKAAAASDLPFAPGIATASELMQALAAGFDLVKFFPAEQAGGIKALRALAGPFPNIRVCPTGGIGEANAANWLAEPNVVAVGGSWLCPAADIRSGNWAGITAMCVRALKSLKPA